MANLGGTFASSLPAGFTYVIDMTLYYDGVNPAAGPFVMNAYQANPTPSSPPGCIGTDCNVVVEPPPTTILNSASGEELTVSASINFPSVTAPGETTVVAVSNVAAAVPSNLGFSDGVTFLDISTTANFDTSSAPITICVDYVIAGALSDPTSLRLLHAEAGAWVDVTTTLDVDTHTICGAVFSLSPFAVASELPPTTTSTSTTSTTSSTSTSTTLPTTDLLPGRVVSIRSGALAKFIAQPAAGETFALPSADPFTTGGALRMFDMGLGAGDDSYALVLGAGWKGLGSPAGSKGYKYKGAGTPGDPCKVVLIKETVIKGVCTGSGINLTPPFDGDIGIVLSLGTTDRYCAQFGGDDVKNDTTLTKRKNAPVPGACP